MNDSLDKLGSLIVVVVIVTLMIAVATPFGDKLVDTVTKLILN